MKNKQRIRPLTQEERQFASDNYYLVRRFLKQSRLDTEYFHDVVILDYLLSVEIYLNNEMLQKKNSFEAVSYMYMRRAVYVHFRKQKALKRRCESGADISFDEVDNYIREFTYSMENFSSLEYMETVKQIECALTIEQQYIFFGKLDGYSLKEIAENRNIRPKQVYKQFGKIKRVVADVMGKQRLLR